MKTGYRACAGRISKHYVPEKLGFKIFPCTLGHGGNDWRDKYLWGEVGNYFTLSIVAEPVILSGDARRIHALGT